VSNIDRTGNDAIVRLLRSRMIGRARLSTLALRAIDLAPASGHGTQDSQDVSTTGPRQEAFDAKGAN